MVKNYKRGFISPINLFMLLVISRMIVCMTYVQSVSVGKLKTDILISVVLGFMLTILFSIPALICVAKGKNPLKVKPVAWLYGIYFIYSAGVNVTRFAYFATSRLNPDAFNFFFIIIIVAAATYAAYLGIEAVSRFGVIASVVVGLGILLIMLFNVSDFRLENMYPIIENSNVDIMKNAMLITSNTAEIVMLIGISVKVNGKCSKAFIWSMALSYILVFAVMLTSIGVMGDYATLQSFPVYSLSQLAKLGNFKRFDVIYSAIWIIAIFVKSALLIYCSSECYYINSKQNEKVHFYSVFASGLAVSVFSIATISGYVSLWNNLSKVFIVAPFIVFSTVIPLITLIFKKKNKGDEVIEKF